MWEFCVCLCFVMHYFVSILVLQSSWRESLLLCYYCLTDLLLLQMFCGSSSRCHGLVCSMCLWYFLIILTYFLCEISKYNLFNDNCFILGPDLIIELLTLQQWKFIPRLVMGEILQYLWYQFANFNQILSKSSLEWEKGCTMFSGRLDKNLVSMIMDSSHWFVMGKCCDRLLWSWNISHTCPFQCDHMQSKFPVTMPCADP